jgi:uncharacterized protein (DUF2236 family)
MHPLQPLRARIVEQLELLGGRHDEPHIYDGEPGDPGLAGGPGSVSWELHGDLGVLGAAGAAAIIMEVLHPSVMAGVHSQSSYRTQPLRRARNTLGYVLRTTFGSTPAATAVIEQVRRIHARVRGVRPDGTQYEALDPKLIAWVHTCIPWAVMLAFERHRRPLSSAEKDRYLKEQAPIGRMGGADWVPESVAELHAFVERIRPELAVTEQTRSFIRFLAEGPLLEEEPPAYERVARRASLRASMGLMPEWAQELTGLRHAAPLARTVAERFEGWRADIARWACPEPPCKTMALRRAGGTAGSGTFTHRAAIGVLASLLMVAGCASSDEPPFSAHSIALCSLVSERSSEVHGRVYPFGTDLGFSYVQEGEIHVLFGDTWQHIDTCPIDSTDDSVATMHVPPDWAGFDADAPLQESQCPTLEFALDATEEAFEPITLQRWDGEPIPLGPLNTPLGGFHDGEAEWAFFLVAGALPCSAEEAMAGASCTSDLSPQAADLTCAFVGNNPRCIDPTSTQRTPSSQRAQLVYLAERTGPAAYTARALFITNKFFNLAARTVARFDPDHPADADYGPGTGALLGWGRPGFNNDRRGGSAPSYFFYHSLPFARSGEQVVFEPRYFAHVAAGVAEFVTSQTGAEPLYPSDIDPQNQTTFTFVPHLARWLMLYGGALPVLLDPDGPDPDFVSRVPGAIHARVAEHPWGTWSDPVPILTEQDAAPHLVCDDTGAPAGCQPVPDPPIRPACLEGILHEKRGLLYGAAVVEPLTRGGMARAGEAAAVDVFWNVSTWHPYGVLLVKSRIAIPR